MSDQALALFGDNNAEMPAYLVEQGSSLGNEEVGQDDVAIPRLDLLQALSKACVEVDAAQPGMLLNSVTNDVFEKVYVLNLKYTKRFAVFPAKGTGFFGEFVTQEAAETEVQNLPGTPADYKITEIGKHLCLLLDEEGQPTQPIIVNFKSTGMAISRKWNSAIQAAGDCDRFASVWQIGSRLENKNNNSWYVMTVDPMGWASEELHAQAKEMFLAVNNQDI